MKTTKSYAPPIVEAITLNAEVGFATSLTTKNEIYNIFDNGDSGVDWE